MKGVRCCRKHLVVRLANGGAPVSRRSFASSDFMRPCAVTAPVMPGQKRKHHGVSADIIISIAIIDHDGVRLRPCASFRCRPDDRGDSMKFPNNSTLSGAKRSDVPAAAASSSLHPEAPYVGKSYHQKLLHHDAAWWLCASFRPHQWPHRREREQAKARRRRPSTASRVAYLPACGLPLPETLFVAFEANGGLGRGDTTMAEKCMRGLACSLRAF